MVVGDITHRFVSLAPDGADPTKLRPSDHNAAHTGALGVVNVKDPPWNVVAGTGADQHSALQDFIDEVVTDHLWGVLPGGRFKISDTLRFPLNWGWRLWGGGAHRTIIEQTSDDIPIFDIGASVISDGHTWWIDGIGFDYTNFQPDTAVDAIPIRFSQMVYQSVLDHCTFFRGAYAIDVVAGVGAPWGSVLGDLAFGGGLSRGAMDWSVAINAVPNNKFGKHLVSGNNMKGPIYLLKGYNWTWDSVEILEIENVELLRLADGSELNLGAIKIESFSYNDGAAHRLINLTGKAVAHIGQVSAGGTLSEIVNAGTRVELLISDAGHLTVDIVDVDASSVAGSTGAFISSASGATGAVRIGYINNQLGGWKKVYQGGTTSGENTRIESEVLGNQSQNLGNADYTVVQSPAGGAAASPNILNFETTFSASRTVNLPASYDNLWNGLWYEIRAYGAINGANHLLVKCNGTTLIDEATDKVILKFMWRRAGSAEAGWVLVGRTVLP